MRMPPNAIEDAPLCPCLRFMLRFTLPLCDSFATLISVFFIWSGKQCLWCRLPWILAVPSLEKVHSVVEKHMLRNTWKTKLHFYVIMFSFMLILFTAIYFLLPSTPRFSFNRSSVLAFQNPLSASGLRCSALKYTI